MALSLKNKIAAVQFAMADAVTVWHTSSASPLTFTYQFDTSQPSDLTQSYSGWASWSSADKAAVRAALAEYAKYLNVNFVEVSGQSDPDISLGRVDLPSNVGGIGSYKYSYATSGSSVTYKELDGFAVFSKSVNLSAKSSMGLILHELGHAMTLKHPGNYDATGNPPPGPFLPSKLDNNKFSVMSYNDNPNTGKDADHLMLLDVAALQARFGANMDTNTGRNVYKRPDSLEVIWDAGGKDKISAKGMGSDVKIDLRPGHFSSLGAKDNLAIAYGAKIENAVGGQGNDTIIGSGARNKVSAGKGNDKIIGNGGNDLLIGSDGKDVIKGGGGKDNLQGGKGADTMFGGKGADKFKYNPGWGPDVVSDFGKGNDLIDLRAFGFATKAKALNQFTDMSTAQQDILEFKFNGHELTVKGSDLSHFGANDILI